MNILEQFDNFIITNNIVNQSDRVLLAVSGGKDSMLMAWLFIHGGYNVEIAHCNFNLRGEESDGDEQLVREFAQSLDIPLHVQSFDTNKYASSNKVSIQMAARELRYAWFEDLRKERACDAIAIAQHKNDHVETLLFNLSRGTGLKGLTGIKQKRNTIIRPLLFLDSTEIATIVVANNIPYRDDSSNFSNKYARNKIRLDIIPEFEKLNADFINIMDDNIERFQESLDVLDDLVSVLRKKLFIPKGEDRWEISKSSIRETKIGLIYLLFEPFHFNKAVLKDLMTTLEKESGRVFESEDFIVLSDRTTLVLKRKVRQVVDLTVDTLELDQWKWGDSHFECSVTTDCTIVPSIVLAKIDIEKLCFPLTVRTWQEGDVFQPLGMNGNKKISDFFIQRKVNILDKQEVPILVNGNGEIIWVVGFQLDDRYKITKKTKKVLKLVFHK